MPRIAPVEMDRASRISRHSLRAAKRRLGQVPNNFATLAHDTPTVLSHGAFELGLERVKAVDHKLVELGCLKAANVIGCEFCIDIGSWIARETGYTEEQLLDLPRHRESERFTETEKLVCDLAVAMSRTPVEVTDELVAALVAQLGERGVVALTSAIAWENTRARFNAALDIAPNGFSEALSA